MRFLALGDSYTIGEGVDPAQRWPAQLTQLLRAAGTEIEDPVIVARTGWTTGELIAALDAARPGGTWDLVSLLIGVNNQYRGLSVSEYEAEFDLLLARAIALAGGDHRRSIVLSVPDWGVTPFAEGRDRHAIGREIDAFNAAAHAVAARRGSAWIDVTGVSREMADMLASDGLHPSGEMYGEWARLAFPAARAALSA